MSCGFDSLPNQVTTRRTSHGLSFNVMVVGPTGIGKTTLINSLFDFDYGDSPDLERKIASVEPRVQVLKPENKTTEMNFTIIETKGFDNQLDKTNSCQPILDYINARFKEYLDNELEVESTDYRDLSDTRVHCCIYMIAPTGTGLKAVDLAAMKALHVKVCLIPVVAKSDVLTEHEKLTFREKIRQEVAMNNIKVFSPADLPLFVAASNEVIMENSKRHRVRFYPWGKLYIEKDTEFSRLRDLVLRNNMLSLVDTTNRLHYEEFRKELTSVDPIKQDFLDFQAYYETKKASLLREISKLEKQQHRQIQRNSPLSGSPYRLTPSRTFL